MEKAQMTNNHSIRHACVVLLRPWSVRGIYYYCELFFPSLWKQRNGQFEMLTVKETKEINTVCIESNI